MSVMKTRDDDRGILSDEQIEPDWNQRKEWLREWKREAPLKLWVKSSLLIQAGVGFDNRSPHFLPKEPKAGAFSTSMSSREIMAREWHGPITGDEFSFELHAYLLTLICTNRID